jgi:hypothetical protein
MFDKVIEPYVRGALEVALGDYTAAKEFLTKELIEVKEEEDVEEKEDTEKVAAEEPEEVQVGEDEVDAANVDIPTKTPYETVRGDSCCEGGKI